MGRINILVALKCEASPLVEHLQLTKCTKAKNGILIYENCDTLLAVSGVGKANARRAVNQLASRASDGDYAAWLNIGIGGHGTRSVGDAIIANRIVDRSSDETWYPSFVRKFHFDTGPVATVEQPETEYRDESVYEMEASAFFPSACKFSKLELVHCIKIISDNRQQSPFDLSREDISKLVQLHVNSIAAVCSMLRVLVESLNSRTSSSAVLDEFLAHWHFTQTQIHQLQRILNKCYALGMDVAIDHGGFNVCGDSRSVISLLRDRLNEHWS